MENNVTTSSTNLHTFQEVKERFFVYISDKDARKKIEEAYLFAEKAHKGQMRKSGEPYIHHLIEVCYILVLRQNRIVDFYDILRSRLIAVYFGAGRNEHCDMRCIAAYLACKIVCREYGSNDVQPLFFTGVLCR